MVGESAARWSRIGIGMSIAVALCGIGAQLALLRLLELVAP